MSRKKRRPLYPGVAEAEKERSKHKHLGPYVEEEPDFIAGAPNYDKWPDKSPEEVLVMLNID